MGRGWFAKVESFIKYGFCKLQIINVKAAGKFSFNRPRYLQILNKVLFHPIFENSIFKIYIYSNTPGMSGVFPIFGLICGGGLCGPAAIPSAPHIHPYKNTDGTLLQERILMGVVEKQNDPNDP